MSLSLDCIRLNLLLFPLRLTRVTDTTTITAITKISRISPPMAPPITGARRLLGKRPPLTAAKNLIVITSLQILIKNSNMAHQIIFCLRLSQMQDLEHNIIMLKSQSRGQGNATCIYCTYMRNQQLPALTLLLLHIQCTIFTLYAIPYSWHEITGNFMIVWALIFFYLQHIVFRGIQHHSHR